MAEIEVKGLAAFRKELRKLEGKTFTDALKDEHQKVAQRVVDASQRRARSTGRRNVVVAATTLKASRTVAGAVVRGGSAQIPWAGAAMFGTRHDVIRQGPRGPYRGWNQFLPAKTGGYVVYPAIKDEESEIVRMYLAGIDRVMRDAFPD